MAGDLIDIDVDLQLIKCEENGAEGTLAEVTFEFGALQLRGRLQAGVSGFLDAMT